MTSVVETLREILEAQGIEASLQSGSLALESTRVTTPAEVRAALAAFCQQGKSSGWVQTTSNLGRPNDPEVASGIILCAELAREDESLAIRQDANGGWLLIKARRDEAGSGVLQQVRARGRKPFGEQIYEVAWEGIIDAFTGQRRLAQVASRLLPGEEG